MHVRAALRCVAGAVLLVSTAAGVTTAGSPAASAADPARARSCGWVLEPSADRENVLFPDTGTRYLGAAIPVPPGGWIEITGQFPHARYMSLQTYSIALQTATNLHDDQIDPDPGSTNPFRVGADRNATRRNYTVLIKQGRPPAAGPAANTLYTDSAQGGKSGIAFAYRIYLPDRTAGAFGGVPAPRITIVGAGGRVRLRLPTCPDVVPDLRLTQTLASVGLPEYGLPPIGILAPQVPVWRKYVNAPTVYGTDLTENQYTFNTLSPLIAGMTSQLPSGLGENIDNKYVYAYLSQEWGEVALFRAKIPTTPRTFDGEATVPPPQQLRYWSLCTADRTTQTYGCVNDENVQVDRDGYVTVAVSTAADRPANATDACGISWLPWGLDPKGIIYLRNMLPSPDFAQAVQNSSYGTEQQTMGDFYPAGSYYPTPQAFEQQVGCHPNT